MKRKTKIKFTDFECNLLINGRNEFRNMLLSHTPTRRSKHQARQMGYVT